MLQTKINKLKKNQSTCTQISLHTLKSPTHRSYTHTHSVSGLLGWCWAVLGKGGGKGGGGSICAGKLGAWQPPLAAQPSIRPIHPSFPQPDR